MLAPKKTKYRKQFRGRMKGKAGRGTNITFGEFALKARSAGWLSSRQIEAGRKVLTRYTRKGGRIWIRVFPNKPVSDKPAESKMGGGKGEVVEYVFVVKPGRIIFEMSGIEERQAYEAMRQAGSKLPIRTKFFKNE